MKMIIKDKKDASGNVVYPVLMKSKDDEMVVLFTGFETGIKMVTSYGVPETDFESEENWIDANDGTYWELFTGTIELSN